MPKQDKAKSIANIESGVTQQQQNKVKSKNKNKDASQLLSHKSDSLRDVSTARSSGTLLSLKSSGKLASTQKSYSQESYEQQKKYKETRELADKLEPIIPL